MRSSLSNLGFHSVRKGLQKRCSRRRKFGSSRSSLRKLHGLTVGEVEAILTDLAQHAIVLKPVAGPPAPDAGDQLLWDLLAARPDLLLVTGDKLLLRDVGMRGRVISTQAFVAGI